MPIYKAWYGTVELTEEQADFLHNTIMGEEEVEDAVYRFTLVLGQENVPPEDTIRFVRLLMQKLEDK